MAFCLECGQKLQDGAMFCHNCGARNNPQQQAQPVNQTEAEPAVMEAEPIPQEALETPTVETAPVEEPVFDDVEKTVLVNPTNEQPTAETNDDQAWEATTRVNSQSTFTPPPATPDPAPAEEPAPEYMPKYVASTAGGGLEEVAPSKKGKYGTVGTFYYIGFTILYSLPVIGLIVSIIMALVATKNTNKHNFAKAFLTLNIIGLVILLGLAITAVIFSQELLEVINDILGESYSEWQELINAYEF